jgi:hypothetical protein
MDSPHGDYHGSNPSGATGTISGMRTTYDGSGQVGEGRALTLVPSLPAPQPWYANALLAPAVDRRELEDERTRLLARAVGDHLPYELGVRVVELA